MVKIKENRVLKSVLAFLNLKNSTEVDDLIKRKDEFNNNDSFGLTWIIKNLIRNTKQPNLLGTNKEQETLVEQWLEYVSTHLCHLNTMQPNEIHSILKEINEILSVQVFLAGFQLTIADVIFYYLMYTTVSKLSFYEKEKFVHLSRWFNYLQQDKRVRQSNKLLIFSRSSLYS